MKIKNWSKFQHFKDRKPPWVKLYRDLLDDIEWHELDAEAAKVLVMLWLIASESDGFLPSSKELSFRLRIPVKSVNACVSKLSHWLEQDDINVISDISAISERYQGNLLETETETETEGEKETETEKYDARAHLLSIGVDDAVIKDWFVLRKSKRLPPTKTAIEEILKEIEKAGMSPPMAIKECCGRGWGSFKAAWLNGERNGKNGSSRGDRVSATIAELTGASRDNAKTFDGDSTRVD